MKLRDRFGHLGGGLRRAFEGILVERQYHVRVGGRVRFVVLSRGKQAVALALVAGALGWSAYASSHFVRNDELLAAKDVEIAEARLAYTGMLDQVAAYQKRFNATARELEESRRAGVGTVEQNAGLRHQLRTLEEQLASARAEGERGRAARESLRGELAQIEQRMKALSETTSGLRGTLENTAKSLQSTIAERDGARTENADLKRRVRDLEGRLASVETRQQDALQRVSEQTLDSIDSIEKVVSLAGLDARSMVRKGAPKGGQGGPFVEFVPGRDRDDAAPVSLTSLDHSLTYLDALKTVVGRLPLASPLETYSLNSTFGKRRDPLNGRLAMHYGLDLASDFRAPVLATAPGTVVEVGWKDRYGRLVELDHGGGLKTRYAHLDKTLVKQGQKVGFRDKIGLLGNTGRSTGAHLHYEVLLDGRPQDPERFIRAGQYVFKN